MTHDSKPALGIRTVILTLAVASAPALAVDTPLRCNPDGNQQEINTCAADDYRAADRDLNATYGHLMGQLAPKRKAALRAEQRTWLKRRDPLCKRKVKGFMGGSIWPAEFHACLAAVTKARTADLKKWSMR